MPRGQGSLQSCLPSGSRWARQSSGVALSCHACWWSAPGSCGCCTCASGVSQGLPASQAAAAQPSDPSRAERRPACSATGRAGPQKVSASPPVARSCHRLRRSPGGMPDSRSPAQPLRSLQQTSGRHRVPCGHPTQTQPVSGPAVDGVLAATRICEAGSASGSNAWLGSPAGLSVAQTKDLQRLHRRAGRRVARPAQGTCTLAVPGR